MILTNTITKTNIPYRRFPKYQEPIKLNLGCGEEELKGYIGIDVSDFKHNMVWDLRDGIPFPDESVDEIYSCHLLEHFDDDSLSHLLIEIYRVLKPGCLMRNRLPHQQDPTAYYIGHKTFWNEAKVRALPRFPGLEGFKIITNERIGAELFFTLKK